MPKKTVNKFKMSGTNATGSKLYDANLGDILQDVKRVDTFLEVIFEFLYRRTDFYRIMEKESDTMGLPPGVAKRLVMQAYMKYDRMAHRAPNQAPDENKPEIKQEEPVMVDKVVEVETEPSIPIQEQPTEAPGEEKTATNDSDETGNQEMVKKPVSSRGLTSADTYNGAERENYCWSQTLADVDLKVFVPEDVKKGKQVEVKIKNKSIKISTKQGTTITDGELVNEVHSEECMWSLHPGNYVQLTLEKKVETWWKSVFQGEPEIDQKSIDNTLNVHEMDSESKADYDRVMYDMEQKRQGKPTVKEMETQEMLRKAWNAEGSPFAGSEFDPSKVNIST